MGAITSLSALLRRRTAGFLVVLKNQNADFAAEPGARRVNRPSPAGSDTDFAELNGFTENAAVSRLIFVR